MAKAKYEEATIYLRTKFGDKEFSYEEAVEYLSTTPFGKFTKASWNAMEKHNIIGIDNDKAKFLDGAEEIKGDSDWIKSRRRNFTCKLDPSKSGIGDFFTKEDIEAINEMYFSWKTLGERFQDFGCRRMNLPEVVSEGLTSALFGYARTNNSTLTNIDSSADLVDVETGDAIQVKSISVNGTGNGGPTSFGPNTTFDRLIVAHFRLDEDRAYFYNVDAHDYKNWKVNNNETIGDQQAQGKRPRLHLLPIIHEENIEPFAIYDFRKGLL